ncbi:serine hydrolase [Bacillus spongiae]|uniref:Serine hydrolase n=1 Tax=Bacillus spongiae TaxID=2683610 RepID=A0ABU8HJ38_9BACI
MKKNHVKRSSVIDNTVRDLDFSGVILVKGEKEMMLESVHGFANRSEEIVNTFQTRFGIASGCKLFTSIAIAQLVDKGMLTFQTRLKDCLDIDFPHFDESITIHHLLTHSSGIPDYFDEAVMEYEEIWKEKPMYTVNQLQDFLPMFQYNSMMFTPGERFHYNNSGFIILGLIVEQQTGLEFSEYVEAEIFKRCDMKDSGYFSLDRLPKHTAVGYIDNEKDGTWRTNVYSIPIKGGADGGAYVTASDYLKLWEGLMSHKLLSEGTTKVLLTPHICEKDEEYYGYGIWIRKRNGEIYKYHVMGYDPGVSFHSSFYPKTGVKVVIPSNKEYGPYKVTLAIEEEWLMD